MASVARPCTAQSRESRIRGGLAMIPDEARRSPLRLVRYACGGVYGPSIDVRREGQAETVMLLRSFAKMNMLSQSDCTG